MEIDPEPIIPLGQQTSRRLESTAITSFVESFASIFSHLWVRFPQVREKAGHNCRDIVSGF